MNANAEAERIRTISECVDTIALCVAEQEPGHWSSLLGEMDLRRELHGLLYGEECRDISVTAAGTGACDAADDTVS